MPIQQPVKFDLDAVLFAGSTGAAIAAKAGYPSVMVSGGFISGADGKDTPDYPLGVTLAARAWSEHKLLRLGYAFEQASRIRKPPPDLPALSPLMLCLPRDVRRGSSRVCTLTGEAISSGFASRACLAQPQANIYAKHSKWDMGRPKALGLEIPPALLARTDEVIECDTSAPVTFETCQLLRVMSAFRVTRKTFAQVEFFPV